MFVCCGDALFDLFAAPAAEDGHITLTGRVGGSPLNVAVGLARLGAEVSFLGKNSSDAFGQRIAAFLRANGVGTDLLIASERNSTLALATRRTDGSVDYRFYIAATADRSLTTAELPAVLPAAAHCVHVASYSTVAEPTAGALLALVRREHAQRFISYDPNVRLSIEPDLDRWRQQVAAFSRQAHLVKASDVDIEALYGRHGSEAFVADCLSRGALLVCVTRGAAGARAYARGGAVAESPAVPVTVVDTIGAGDAFTATMLRQLAVAGFLQQRDAGRLDLEDLLRHATHAAAIACSRAGADLPTADELGRALSGA